MDLQYYKHTRIDLLKWDKTISSSFNGNIFAYSWYLDIVCEGWEAIISDNYEYIMPITIDFRYRNLEIQQPLYCHQLGIFSVKPITDNIIQKFIEAIPPKINFYNIHFNKLNNISDNLGDVTNHNIFQLDLIAPQQKRALLYGEHLKELLVVLEMEKYTISQGNSVNAILQFLQENTENVNTNEQGILRRLITLAISRNLGKFFMLHDNTNTLVGVFIVLFANYMAFPIVLKISKNIPEENGYIMLLDYFIKQFSERNLTLAINTEYIKIDEKILKEFGAEKYNYQSLKSSKTRNFWNIFKK